MITIIINWENLAGPLLYVFGECWPEDIEDATPVGWKVDITSKQSTSEGGYSYKLVKHGAWVSPPGWGDF